MIDQIEKPKIERVEIGENSRYGKFVVNPLERGFGQTLGNSLRRVLLNSLPGVAATSVRIEGVQHEFSTVPGVKEDVAELILNIKLLSAKLFTEQPKMVTIDAHGPCEVTAADIKACLLYTSIKDVVFDRGGYIYTGRVAELAAGAREGGLNF